MSRRAFTLIELLIVVTIIGILAAIAVPNFLNALVRAKVSRAISDMRALHQAMESYAVDHGDYPYDFDFGKVYRNDSMSFFRLTTPIAYISNIPVDPFFYNFYDSKDPKYKYETPFPYFGYLGPPHHRNSQDWQATGTRYTLSSFAPNRLREGVSIYSPSNPILQDRLYHPSNGLLSLGDLYASNHGVILY